MTNETQKASEGSGNIIFTQGLSVEQTTERGIILSDRMWQRTIIKLEACKERGLAEVWIAVGGIALGGVASAWIGLKTLSGTALATDKGYLIMTIVFGFLLAAVCALGYITTREKHNKTIEMVIGDMRAQRSVDELPTRSYGDSSAS